MDLSSLLPPAPSNAFWSVLVVLALVGAGPALCPPAQAQQAEVETRIEFLKYGAKATTVAQSRTGQYVAIGARDVPSGGSRVVLWDRILQERARTISYPANQAPRVALDSAGTRLAVAPTQEPVTVLNLDRGRETAPQHAAPTAHDVSFGPRGLLGTGSGTGEGGTIRVWPNGPANVPTELETNGPVRSLAFRPSTPEVVLTSGPTQVTLWNYRFNTTKRIDTYGRCTGLLRQVALPDRGSYFVVITQRRAECNPDYLCTISTEDRTVLDRFQRKNVSTVEPLRGDRVAFSRGRYVYTLNLQTREEHIVFTSENKVHDLSYVDGRLAVANSDVVLLDL